MKYLVHALALIACSSVHAGKLLLTWDANPAMEEVFGYMVYERQSDGQIVKLGKVGVNRAALVDVPIGEHCFLVTAANEHGESDFSKEVCIRVSTGQLQGDIRLDRIPPRAEIIPLPASTPNTFTVEWGGEDDAEGVGIDHFDVFVSVDGGAIQPWLLGTKTTRQDYSGMPGRQYLFYVVAVDIGGNRSVPDLASQTQTRVPLPNRAPVIASLATVTARAGQVIEIPIQASDVETPPGQLHYALCDSPHPSATIDPATGMFRWFVDPALTLQTNRFVICVTDNGDPAATASQTLNVVVRDFLRVELGTAVVEAARIGRLPLRVHSSVPGWYLSMELETPGGSVNGLGFLTDKRLVCVDGMGPTGTRTWQWMGQACETGLFARRGTVGSLEVGVTQIQSQLIPVSIKNVVAMCADGSLITDVHVTGGKLIMLGDEPVLDTVVVPGQNAMTLYLYGVPGFYYSLDYTMDPTLQSGWVPGWQGVLEKHYERFHISYDMIPNAFFRARELTSSLMLPMPYIP